jgi:hypothetical protein
MVAKAKEKAKDVYNRMAEWVTDAHIYKERNIISITAIQCALIHVDEILELQLELAHDDNVNDIHDLYIEVKKELKNMELW